jgi:hypothetical protein
VRDPEALGRDPPAELRRLPDDDVRAPLGRDPDQVVGHGRGKSHEDAELAVRPLVEQLREGRGGVRLVPVATSFERLPPEAGDHWTERGR